MLASMTIGTEEFDLPLSATRRDLRSRASAVYLCPVCGEIWARLWFPGSRWWAVHKPCPVHPTTLGEVAGSVVSAELDLEEIDGPLLERELSVHLDHFARYGGR